MSRMDEDSLKWQYEDFPYQPFPQLPPPPLSGKLLRCVVLRIKSRVSYMQGKLTLPPGLHP